MKRMFLASILIAAVAATAAFATSSDFGGKIEKGGKVGLDTDGGTDHVDRIRFQKFPAKCNGNPNFTIGALWTPASDVPVVDNKFTANLADTSTDPDSTLEMSGKLNGAGSKITGKIKAKQVFNGNTQVCTTKRRDYSAGLGKHTLDMDAPFKAVAHKAR